jgi:hypothetical protein
VAVVTKKGKGTQGKLIWTVGAVTLALLTGWRLRGSRLTAHGAAREAQRPSVTFADVTESAGIRFVHNNGADGKKYMPKTVGSGCAFFDYDNDGWLDVFLVNSMDWRTPSSEFGTRSPERNKSALRTPHSALHTAKALSVCALPQQQERHFH